MLIAVTGAFGFIGQEVVSRLLSRGNRVALVDYWDRLIPHYETYNSPILESVYSTSARAEALLSPSEFLDWLGAHLPDAVVHLGAIVDTRDLGSSGALFSENIVFTRDLVHRANLNRGTQSVPGIVFASSAAVYGSDCFPNNPYGFTKSIGERAVAETRGEFSVLRFFNVFGRNEHHKGPMASMPFKIAAAYRAGNKIDMHSLSSARDFVPVTTVADKVVAYAELLGSRDLDEPEIRSVEDLGTGYATTFADLDNFIMQATRNITSCVREVPIPPTVLGRFQHYTCAGTRATNAGLNSQSTRDAIEEIYGNPT